MFHLNFFLLDFWSNQAVSFARSPLNGHLKTIIIVRMDL